MNKYQSSVVKQYISQQEIEHIFTTKSCTWKLLFKLLDINTKEQHRSANVNVKKFGLSTWCEIIQIKSRLSKQSNNSDNPIYSTLFQSPFTNRASEFLFVKIIFFFWKKKFVSLFLLVFLVSIFGLSVYFWFDFCLF